MVIMPEQQSDDEAAIVRAVLDYFEYVQLARTKDGWRVVNTLWQRR